MLIDYILAMLMKWISIKISMYYKGKHFAQNSMDEKMDILELSIAAKLPR